MSRKIKIVGSRPVIWPLLKLLFPSINLSNYALTWGETIYSQRALTFDQVEHEKVHAEQQGNKVWGLVCIFRYRFSLKYRKRCEVQAYRRQWRALGGDKKARNKIAMLMSNPIYGPMFSYKEALSEIR